MHNLLRKTNYINILILISIGIFLFSGVAWAGNNGLTKSLVGDKSIKFNGGKSSYKSVGESAPKFNSGAGTFKPSIGRVPKAFNPGTGSYRLNGNSNIFKSISGSNSFKVNTGTRAYKSVNVPKAFNPGAGSYKLNGNGNTFKFNTPGNALKQVPLRNNGVFKPSAPSATLRIPRGNNFKLAAPPRAAVFNSGSKNFSAPKQFSQGSTTFRSNIGTQAFKFSQGSNLKISTPSKAGIPNVGTGKVISGGAPKFNSPRVMSAPKPAQQLPKNNLTFKPANFKFNTARSLNIAQNYLTKNGQAQINQHPTFKLASLPLKAPALPTRGPEAPVSPFQRPQPLNLPAPASTTGSNAPASNANSQPTNTGGGHTGNHGHSPVATILFGLFGHLPIPFRERMRKMLSGISQRQNNGIGSVFAARAPAIDAVAECSLAFDHRLQPEESVTFTPAENRIERKGFFVSSKVLIFRSLELNSGLFCFPRQNGR